MNNQLLQIKFTQRLNKLSSNDYSNIECWMIAEAFNKALDAWTIRNLQGINLTKTTAEGSIRAIDKLQVILKNDALTMTNQGIYWEATLPNDYLEWSRLSASALNPCCPARRLKIYLAEEADLDILLSDRNRQPDYNWAETFCTLMGNTVKVYTNDKFEITEPVITYYKKPKHIQIANCTDPDTGLLVTTDVECEYPDTVIEIIIDEAAAIVASDIDNYMKSQFLSNSAERSN